jgi:hypothetical protein
MSALVQKAVDQGYMSQPYRAVETKQSRDSGSLIGLWDSWLGVGLTRGGACVGQGPVVR